MGQHNEGRREKPRRRDNIELASQQDKIAVRMGFAQRNVRRPTCETTNDNGTTGREEDILGPVDSNVERETYESRLSKERQNQVWFCKENQVCERELEFRRL